MKNSHGANLFELSKKFDFKIEDIADFSSNINPLGASEKAKKYLLSNMDLISTYPDPEYKQLKEEISKYTEANPENIFLFSGTTEGIREYIKYINPKNAMLLSPCYSEYEHELNKIKANIFYYDLLEKNNFNLDVDEFIRIINKEKIDLIVFANPNNPTGTILESREIEKIMENTDVKILLDETYCEFTNQNFFSSIPLTKKYKNLFIVRGTSKFFAMPGIRLGYGISSSEKINDYFAKNEMLWSINIFACIVGQVIFRDKIYQKKVFEFISSQRNKLMTSLKSIDSLKVYNSQGNFILCRIKNSTTAQELRNYLLKDAMVIRDCSNFKNLGEKYFRVCILDEESNNKLLNKIKEYFK